MRRIAAVLAAALTITGAQGAVPEVETFVLDRSGPWIGAIGFPNGKANCFTAQALSGRRTFSVNQHDGLPAIILRVTNPAWKTEEGEAVRVAVAIDSKRWEGTTNSLGDGVAVAFAHGTPAVTFLQQMALGRQMTLSFPGSRETPWSIDLTGSAKAVESFSACSSTILEPARRGVSI